MPCWITWAGGYTRYQSSFYIHILADIYQDKAEVFSYLFITPLYKKAEDWMRSDPNLAAKFRFMRQALQALSPDFTDDYFQRLHQ